MKIKISNKSNRYTMLGFSPPDVCPHVERVLMRDEKGKVIMMNDKSLTAERQCGARLYEISRWRRTGVGRLVQRKFAHRFKVYIGDEIRKCKSGDSDLSDADGRLLSSIRDSIALTGTLFGGVASSLFYFLYCRSGDVRQHYDFKDVNRWFDHFGLWKYRYMDNGNLKVERGKSSGVAFCISAKVYMEGVRPRDSAKNQSPKIRWQTPANGSKKSSSHLNDRFKPNLCGTLLGRFTTPNPQ